MEALLELQKFLTQKTKVKASISKLHLEISIVIKFSDSCLYWS